MYIGQKVLGIDQNLVILMLWSFQLLEFLTLPKGANSGVAGPKMSKELANSLRVGLKESSQL